MDGRIPSLRGDRKVRGGDRSVRGKCAGSSSSRCLDRQICTSSVAASMSAWAMGTGGGKGRDTEAQPTSTTIQSCLCLPTLLCAFRTERPINPFGYLGFTTLSFLSCLANLAQNYLCFEASSLIHFGQTQTNTVVCPISINCIGGTGSYRWSILTDALSRARSVLTAQYSM